MMRVKEIIREEKRRRQGMKRGQRKKKPLKSVQNILAVNKKLILGICYSCIRPMLLLPIP
jgi:hypothetical protein